MSTQPTVKLLHGRDEHGFVNGSQAQRDFRRLMRKLEPRAAGQHEHYERLRERNLQQPEQITPGAQRRARRAARKMGVEVPAWAVKERAPEDPALALERRLEPRGSASANTKYRARKAARLLGVEVPEWARKQPRQRLSMEHRERIREGLQRRREEGR